MCVTIPRVLSLAQGLALAKPSNGDFLLLLPAGTAERDLGVRGGTTEVRGDLHSSEAWQTPGASLPDAPRGHRGLWHCTQFLVFLSSNFS